MNPNLLADGNRLATRNLVKGFKVHGERLFEKNGEEWREWNPNRSKLAAAIAKGLETGIAEGDSEVFFFSFFFLQITAVPSTAIPMPITVAKIISDVSPAMQRNPDKNVQ